MHKSIYKSLLLTFGLISLQGCYSFAGPTSIGISATPAPGTENLVLSEPENYKSIKAKDIQQIKFPDSNEILDCDFGFTYFSGSSSSWTAGIGSIRNPNINADWYYNNDWGSAWRDEYIVEAVNQNRIRQASCIFKDGTGYFFDIPPTGKWSSLYWHEHSIHIGHKGWSSVGNTFVREKSQFPVKVGDIKELNFDVEYTYDIIGQSDVHLAMWFVDEKRVSSDWVGDEPFLETMVRLSHNTDYPCHDGSFKIMKQRWSYCFKGSGWTQNGNSQTMMRFDSLDIHHPKVNSGHNGKHTFNLKLKDLILGMKKQGYIKDHHTLLGLEFNNELKYGRGVMDIKSMNYKLVTH